MKPILAVAAMFAATIVNAQQVFGDETRAWMVGPAKAVSSGMVTAFQFSSSSNQIIYSRVSANDLFNPSPKEPHVSEWFSYDLASGLSKKINIPNLTSKAEFVALGDERTLYFFERGNPKFLGFFDLISGSVTKLDFSDFGVTYFGERPEAPFLIVQYSGERKAILFPNGQMRELKLPAGTSLITPFYSDRQVIKFSAFRAAEKSYQSQEATISRSTWEVKLRDVPTGQYASEENMDSWSPFRFWENESGGHLELLGGSKPVATSAGKTPSYLERIVRVCHPGANPQMDLHGKCVAYLESGALLIREVRTFDKEAANRIKVAELKAQALTGAKQVGTALLIYAADMDDVLPGGEGFVNKVMPYLLDRKMLDGFNYTFSGGSIDQIKDPAKTELGFTMAPGGRAVVYADGHAQWVPDKI